MSLLNLLKHPASGLSALVEAAGGKARLSVIVMLGAVLGLDTADKGMVSAISGALKQAFGIDNTQIGLLVALVSFVGAVATLPLGALADRLSRRRILLVSVAVWGVAVLVSGFATSYLYLLLSRIALGVVTAAAWPCVASLTGDFFPATQRAGIFGWIVAGEFVGVGVGYLISGEASSLLGWRWSFFAMSIPAIALVWVLWRYLPEPKRGSQSWLRMGEEDPSAATRTRGAEQQEESSGGGGHARSILNKAHRDIRPRQDLVLGADPATHSLWWVIRYLLRVPTYRLLIAASALAYYFFAGMRSFSMIYFTNHYGLSRSTVSALVIAVGLAALVGVVGGGRLSERFLRKGRLEARVEIPAIALLGSIPFFAAAIWVRAPWIGMPLLAAGCATLAAAVAPIDAARLDIVPANLWARGEAGRIALRSAFEGGAPLLFGAMSQWLGGGARGLEWTFLIMLVPMLAAALFVMPARRSYPRDVATAAASGSDQHSRQRPEPPHSKLKQETSSC